MPIEVKDVMGRVAIAVLADASFADIVAAMKRFAVGAVTVVDADRRPVGVVSEDDLLLKEIDTVRHGVSMFESRSRRRDHDKAAGVTAAQLMTSPAITVTPGTSVRDAARLMHAHHIKQLPVIDVVTGRIAGTLHQRDVLRVFTRSAAELEADIRAELPEPGPFTIEIDAGVVRICGRVRRRSQALALTEAVRNVEGVVDVVCDVAADVDDLITVPPLL
ncbi:CBS domain-containing protein [Nonomuraea phyllanthi]|uniref:CBS domain-containing protein n=1 Tax=Nonomuraea phyllanthi TaxID=2219224 RepID=UPI001292F4D1|nr:CBS domain-containing protein [Nonomuraea phyllanthi]QFY09886.1 CBS domain-containing protein [Nonomuraea phyllanthi]